MTYKVKLLQNFSQDSGDYYGFYMKRCPHCAQASARARTEQHSLSVQECLEEDNAHFRCEHCETMFKIIDVDLEGAINIATLKRVGLKPASFKGQTACKFCGGATKKDGRDKYNRQRHRCHQCKRVTIEGAVTENRGQSGGRKRIYANATERWRAWRDRQKQSRDG